MSVAYFIFVYFVVIYKHQYLTWWKMKKIFKNILILFIFAICCTALTACTGKDGKVYGKDKVLAYVKEQCPNEKYELVSVEQVASQPDNYEYTFVSKERDLTFKANSYLAAITIDASTTGFYEKHISCDYKYQVSSLYSNQVKEVLEKYEHYQPNHGWYYIDSFADIATAAQAIVAADQVYKPELEYNTPEFLKTVGLKSVHFVHYPSRQRREDHSTWKNIGDVGTNASLTYDEVYKKLADKYAQMVVDGQIIDDTIPDKYVQNLHRSRLNTIYLNGDEMLYAINRTEFSDWGHTTDDYKYVWYSYDRGQYMMVCDAGMLFKSSSVPMVVYEYVDAMFGQYTASTEENKGKYTSHAEWQIDGVKWTMDATMKSSENIGSFVVKRNGRPLDIDYITVGEDSSVRATFTVGLSVEDFAKLFDLSYEINEKEGYVSFLSPAFRDFIQKD